MQLKQKILELGPHKVLEIFAHQYVTIHGEQKADKILEVVKSSSTLAKFIALLKAESANPAPDSFYREISGTLYFLFAKADTVCFGCCVAILWWFEEMMETPVIVNKALENAVLFTFLTCYPKNPSLESFKRFAYVMNDPKDFAF